MIEMSSTWNSTDKHTLEESVTNIRFFVAEHFAFESPLHGYEIASDLAEGLARVLSLAEGNDSSVAQVAFEVVDEINRQAPRLQVKQALARLLTEIKALPQ